VLLVRARELPRLGLRGGPAPGAAWFSANFFGLGRTPASFPGPPRLPRSASRKRRAISTFSCDDDGRLVWESQCPCGIERNTRKGPQLSDTTENRGVGSSILPLAISTVARAVRRTGRRLPGLRPSLEDSISGGMTAQQKALERATGGHALVRA
jgi:hypothetical protein